MSFLLRVSDALDLVCSPLVLESEERFIPLLSAQGLVHGLGPLHVKFALHQEFQVALRTVFETVNIVADLARKLVESLPELRVALLWRLLGNFILLTYVFCEVLNLVYLFHHRQDPLGILLWAELSLLLDFGSAWR